MADPRHDGSEMPSKGQGKLNSRFRTSSLRQVQPALNMFGLSGNRDRGKPHGSSPPTPCVRVRTRRFRDLSREGRRFVSPFTDRGFAAPRFLSGFTLSTSGKLRRSGLAGAWPSMRAAHYCPRSRFGPSSIAGLSGRRRRGFPLASVRRATVPWF